MIAFFRHRPWIWIVIAFLILITGWVVLLRIASEHRPESVKIESNSSSYDSPSDHAP